MGAPLPGDAPSLKTLREHIKSNPLMIIMKLMGYKIQNEIISKNSKITVIAFFSSYKVTMLVTVDTYRTSRLHLGVTWSMSGSGLDCIWRLSGQHLEAASTA